MRFVEKLKELKLESLLQSVGGVFSSYWKKGLLLVCASLVGAAAGYTFAKNYGLLSKKSVAGKHIMITGAAGGIGSVLSEMFAKQGAKLSMLDVRQSQLKEKSNRIAAIYLTEVVAKTVDIGNEEAVRKIVQQCELANGPVDILINNAGIAALGLSWQLQLKDLVRSMQVNFYGPVLLAKAVLPGMLARNQGHIVNVASFAGLTASRGLTAYCGSKHAMVAFNDTLRMQLRATSVRTTLVCPYYVRTGLIDPNVVASWYKPVMDADWACRRIFHAVLQEQEHVVLPWKMAAVLAVQRVLPKRWNDWLCRKYALRSD